MPNDQTTPVTPEKKYSIGQSLWWHLTSRKSRQIIGAAIAYYLLTNPWFIAKLNLTPNGASNLAEAIVYLSIALVAIVAGEKVAIRNIESNGNDKVSIEKFKDEAVSKIENMLIVKLVKVIDEKLKIPTPK